MADDSQDISDYHDAVEGMLLDGEDLEAVLPSSDDIPNSLDHPAAIGVTSVRLIVCYRALDRGRSDRWGFRSIPFARIDGVELWRDERFRRDRIEASASVIIRRGQLVNGDSGLIELHYPDPTTAREVHDRILAHMLAAQ